MSKFAFIISAVVLLTTMLVLVGLIANPNPGAQATGPMAGKPHQAQERTAPTQTQIDKEYIACLGERRQRAMAYGGNEVADQQFCMASAPVRARIMRGDYR